jgi:hypothetical protein
MARRAAALLIAVALGARGHRDRDEQMIEIAKLAASRAP